MQHSDLFSDLILKGTDTHLNRQCLKKVNRPMFHYLPINQYVANFYYFNTVCAYTVRIHYYCFSYIIVPTLLVSKINYIKNRQQLKVTLNVIIRKFLKTCQLACIEY